MPQPKVSIIIPVYGVEKYLRQCLDSVINQTLQDIEIILIDDGGKDNCPQIIDEYAAKDNRIKAIHKKNGGYGHSCNRGLSEATGEYIGIVEPDDYIDRNMYENLYNIATTDNTDIVKSCFYKKIDTEKNQKEEKMRWSEKFNIPNTPFTIKDCPLFLYFHPSIWSCIYKREFLAVNNIRFIEAPGAGWTDNPFQVQTMCLAKKIKYTDEAYYHWRCINTNESDDLKDYTLPFKRSDEIHEWLNNNNIKDENILDALYARELAYIRIVLRKKDVKGNNDCYKRVKTCCRRMNAKIIQQSKLVVNRNKRMFIRCCISPNIALFCIQIRSWRKKLISFRWNKQEKSLKIFGKAILEKENNKCKQ